MAKKTRAKAHRARTPDSSAFREYMKTGWAPPRPNGITMAPVAVYAKARREAFLDALPKQLRHRLLIIAAGPAMRRSNDTDYPYRPHSAFSYLTGWGSDTVPGSILTVDTRVSPAAVTLYSLAPAGRESEEFYANPAIGEFWTGPRPHLADLELALGLPVADLTGWPGVTEADLSAALIIDDADPWFTIELRARRGREAAAHEQELGEGDAILAQTLSEMRFVKDDYEIEELRRAIGATHEGFDDILRILPTAVGVPRGERIIEGAFAARARRDGNDVGYGTIAAAGHHACILHWVRNDGIVEEGDLVLVDAGVERDSLYTADITRTFPVSGTFSPRQAQVYQAVLDAADAAFGAVKPGVAFRTIHDSAMEVIAQRLDDWGLLPVRARDALLADGGHHRRYMIHGTCHHLGLDVHDCAKARRELYLDQLLVPGMVFTIEPGLYFQADDLTVPEDWRGIGVRIEDNVLVTDTGAENLSREIPRSLSDVEAWVTRLAGR